MSETISVDMSAKVEQWSQNTVVVFSNGIQEARLVSHKVKQQARNWLKIKYPQRRQAFYHYLLFAVFIYVLIKPYLDKIDRIIIDQDYPGKLSEEAIKSWLFHFLRRQKSSLPKRFITFRAIKGSKADLLARQIFKQGRCERHITLQEIQEVLP